jgi:outer membrane protein OmpA-like peptidoglycan-associated protein
LGPPLALASALLCPTAAGAQEAFSIQRFEPSFAGDKLFGVQSPYGAGEGTFLANVLLDYAHDPLVLRDAATGNTVGAIVSGQTFLHVHASYALLRALTFDLDLPFGFQSGDQPAPSAGPAFASPTGAALSDVRLGARATVFGTEEDPFQLALGALVWLPTGSRAAFTSDGQARAEPLLIAGGTTRWFVWSANAGADLRPHTSFDTIATGPAFRWGAGMGLLPGDGTFQIGPELFGSVPFTHLGKSTVDVEALAGARMRFAKLFVAGIAAGGGFTAGAGTPDFRTVLSIGYEPLSPRAPPDRDGDAVPDVEDACPDEKGVRTADPKTNGCPPPPNDRDGDGIPDEDDACPDVPGVRDPVRALNGCPPDRDNDGIPDGEDACPDQIGPRDPDPKKNGCPLPSDRDNDGIPDDKDACPDVPGSADPDPKKNGCPGDRDKDGIPDDKDACPDEKGPADPDPKKNGCPKEVRVADDQIVLLEQVEFDLGKATIRAQSNRLLGTIVQVLTEHPEVTKVEVQGHTDNRGAADENMKLSQRRAEAVRDALVKRGVAPERLTAAGYGSNKPIMSNLTTIGRQKNRRVELRILEKTAKKRP